jgi:putative phosphoribosyl transferase
MTRNFSIPIRPSGFIYGDLEIPLVDKPLGLCIFAHGSGSSRFSSRNQYVAHILQSHGIATLLIDLLTPQGNILDLSIRSTRR